MNIRDTAVNKTGKISVFWELLLYKGRQTTNKQTRQCWTELSEVDETRQCGDKALRRNGFSLGYCYTDICICQKPPSCTLKIGVFHYM